MPSYHDLVQKYRKRRRDDVVDAVTTGLSLADNVSVDLGLLDDTGLGMEFINAVETVSNVLPFAVIAVTEQCNVLLGKKTAVAGASDTAYRFIKTGAAMGVGAAVASTGAGALAALPVAAATRLILDRYRSRSLTGHRVSLRTQRLRAINEQRMKDAVPVEE